MAEGNPDKPTNEVPETNTIKKEHVQTLLSLVSDAPAVVLFTKSTFWEESLSEEAKERIWNHPDVRLYLQIVEDNREFVNKLTLHILEGQIEKFDKSKKHNKKDFPTKEPKP